MPNLSEEALRWEPAPRSPGDPQFDFASLQFPGDPATAADESELHRQACELGKAMVATPSSLVAFGLAPVGEHGAEEPVVESIRSLRRIGPDNQVVFDLVAEVTQRRIVPLNDAGTMFPFVGGATVILGPEGNVRHTIYKRALNDSRVDAQRQFLLNEGGSRTGWREEEQLTPIEAPFALLHANDRD